MSQKISKILIIFSHFFTIWAEVFYESSGEYYLSISVNKSRFWALFVIFDILGPNKGRGPTGNPMSLGPQNPTKTLTHLVNLLGHPLSRNHLSNFSDLGPPSPPLISKEVFKLEEIQIKIFPCV